ncbi:MAG: TonB-dependent receptor plug domain-containing protein, partial [Acidobacteriaceae bacterium]|nr:TonB-dependent receptor plug domain-containing protein [Acidobacteriaceae bacterium]MBV9295310.1 TonB-dependent receptor plug domain-containing protein [Acidobacteriaceae bacterium]
MFAKLCLFTLTLAYVCAASGGATINGTVSDESGAPITGALVNLHETFGFVLLANTSDSAGHFTFSGVTAGQYLLDASAPGLSVAQPQTLNIEAGAVVQVAVELVVSATKSQVSVTAADSPQSVDQVSKALDIVNVPDAERRGLLSVVDAVRFVPGMRVSTRGSIGEFSTIQARGLRTTDTDILVDGFPFRDVTSIQDEASAFVGDLLLVDSSQIEVLRGSGSSLYGTNSTAGTVNILTDPGGGPAHGNIDLQGGGLGLFRGLASVAGGALQNRLTYSAGVTHLNVSKGADNVEATRDWSSQGAVSFALASNMRLAVDLFATTGYL